MTAQWGRAPHRTVGEQVFVWLGSLASTLVMVVTLAGIAATAWPYQPLTHFKISVPTGAAVGDELGVFLDYCKTSDWWVPREIRWHLVNDVTVGLDGPKAALPAGCDPHRYVALYLSPHVAPGRYRLQVDVIYQPLPWREIPYSRQSEPFEVR
jgi:hypothetical protein